MHHIGENKGLEISWRKEEKEATQFVREILKKQ